MQSSFYPLGKQVMGEELNIPTGNYQNNTGRAPTGDLPGFFNKALSWRSGRNILELKCFKNPNNQMQYVVLI
jgi:hypothetical protein